jgi:hypothetical protein
MKTNLFKLALFLILFLNQLYTLVYIISGVGRRAARFGSVFNILFLAIYVTLIFYILIKQSDNYR